MVKVKGDLRSEIYGGNQYLRIRRTILDIDDILTGYDLIAGDLASIKNVFFGIE